MAFCGWPSSALTFFSGLEADNTKTYWLTHRETYDKAVRAPMDLLLESLLDEFGPGKVFRPYGWAGRVVARARVPSSTPSIALHLASTEAQS